MRKILFISFLLLGLWARAAEIALSPVSGKCGEEVEITLSIADPGNATALEVDIPMPDGVSFVSKSVTKKASTGHVASGDVKNGELRVLMHSLSMETLPAGELLSFKLKLGKVPGNFSLNPKVILSDASGNKLDCRSAATTVIALSPFIEISPALVDFGRQAIRGKYSRSFSIRNTGNETLEITDIIPSAMEFSIAESLPISIPAGSSTTLTLNYAPIIRANSISESLKIESNAVNGNAILGITAIPFSVNELHVASGLSGNSDEEVTISLRLNNMEPIAGIQAEFSLPSALKFVEDSAEGIGRGGNLSVSAVAEGNLLKILAYSLNGQALQEGNDDVLSFRVKLEGRSGSYYLNPQKVLLSNKDLENMTSATYGSYVSINSPSISTVNTLGFGNVAVGSEGNAGLSVYNAGQAPLTIDRIILTNDIFSLEEKLPVTIPSYGTVSLPFKVSPAKEGRQSAVGNIYSNDPENRLKTVNFIVDAFESNQLTLSGSPNDDYTSYMLNVGLENYTEITALQMDIRWIEGMTTAQKDLQVSSRCSDHSFSVASMGNGVYRIILFSMSNTPFRGNTGDLFSLTFHGEDFTNTTLSAENIILSSSNGKNYTSPGASITVVAVTAVKVSEINLSESSLELKATESRTIIADVLPSNAEIKSVSWSTSNPAIATVSAEGVVTAVSVGDAVITATANDDSGVKAVCNVTVVPTPAESIKISTDGEPTLKATESLQLTATVLPETTTDKSVYWKSDNTDIATVSQEGLVTAVSVGKTVITATNSAGQTDQVTITVIPTPVETIQLNRSTADIKVEGGFQLQATVLPTTATNKTVEWKSSKPEIVSVDSDGNVKGLQLGQSIITCSATDDSGITATCVVTVGETAAESVSIAYEGSTTLKATETLQLTATVLPATTTDKSVNWQSSAPEVATVDAAGVVTAMGVGTAVITATNSAGQSDNVTITVVETLVENIILNRTSATLRATQTLALTATVLPATATNPTLKWSSSNESVASVNPEGLVTALSVGETEITATATDGSSISGSCTVTVEATSAQSITINYDGETMLKATESLQLTATVLPETTTDKSVTWTSSAAEVASVSDNGLVTAIAVGQAIITATNSAGQTDQITITVIPTPVESITLNRTSVNLKATETFECVATVLPVTATNKHLNWSSDNTQVATVSDEGMVTALAIGIATIRVSAADDSGVFAECSVNVVSTPAENIVISAEGETSLKATETLQLKADVYPETATDKSVTWFSETPSVATVNATGLVTAVAVGQAKIHATASNGTTGYITITVIPTPVSSIVLSETEVSLKASESVILTADILPERATDKSISWSSEDESVAIVTSEGKVIAVSVGSTTVTAKANDGSDVKASCNITVIPTAPESIEIIAEGETTVEVGQTVQLKALIMPETTTDKSVMWQSDTPHVATVDKDGLVTACAEGQAIIFATTSAGQKGQITITVFKSEIPAEGIRIVRDRDFILDIGEIVKLNVEIYPEETTDKAMTWKSDNEGVANVDVDGTVTAVSPGMATISVYDNYGHQDSVEIEVIDLSSVDKIFLNNDTLNIYDLNGVLLIDKATAKNMKNLIPGIYIINGKKVMIR